MTKTLKVRLWDKKTGEFNTVTQAFIPLRKVLDWLKLEEEIAEMVDNQQKLFKYFDDLGKGKEVGEIPETTPPLSDIEIFERRIRLIADLFDNKEVTYDALLDNANAMDKLIVDVQEIVMNQYSKADGSNESGKD